MLTTIGPAATFTWARTTGRFNRRSTASDFSAAARRRSASVSCCSTASADAFPDGYRFELHDGATRVSRFER